MKYIDFSLKLSTHFYFNYFDIFTLNTIKKLVRVGVGIVCIQAKWPIRPELISSFSNMK